MAKELSEHQICDCSGRGRGPNPKLSALLLFGSFSEREECLRQRYNLAGTPIKIDKYVPKKYEAQYRIFKDKAWKLRETMDVNTRA